MQPRRFHFFSLFLSLNYVAAAVFPSILLLSLFPFPFCRLGIAATTFSLHNNRNERRIQSTEFLLIRICRAYGYSVEKNEHTHTHQNADNKYVWNELEILNRAIKTDFSNSILVRDNLLIWLTLECVFLLSCLPIITLVLPYPLFSLFSDHLSRPPRRLSCCVDRARFHRRNRSILHHETTAILLDFNFSLYLCHWLT